MSVNILVDFEENGIEKNEPHIVWFTDDITTAGRMVKKNLESRGCMVNMMMVKGDWSLSELHDTANYGTRIAEAEMSPIYISEKTKKFFEEMRNNPQKMREEEEKLRERMKRK